MNVMCDGVDGCGKRFAIDKFMVEKLNNGIEKTYFKCQHCSKQFISFYTDKIIRAKQAKIRKMTKEEEMRRMKDVIATDMYNLRRSIEIEKNE